MLVNNIWKKIHSVNVTLITLSEENVTQLACNKIIQETQQGSYPDVISCFSKNKVPNIVSLLNLLLDKDNILRVGGKMNRKSCNDPYFPILLPKNRYATQIIVVKTHWVLKHSRIYSVLANLRRQFYISNCFTVVKKKSTTMHNVK